MHQVLSDAREFPAYSQIYLRNYNGHVYSYGRHSPGLRVNASPLAGMTSCLNLRALGRCQSVYCAFAASHRPVFLLNSQLTLFTVSSPSFRHKALHRASHPFFRSYGASLPSSLTRGHSSALVCSTCLPVSDCGTGTAAAPHDGFSRQCSLSQFTLTVVAAPHRLSPLTSRSRATSLDRDNHSPDDRASCVTAVRQTPLQW